MLRHDPGVLGVSSTDGKLEKAYIVILEETPVLYPCEEAPQKELVLVEQYYPGTGNKRSPSFHVEFGPEVRILSSASTSGGSGGESWTLVSAPLGWAENIAEQFIDQRDYLDQTISYRPGVKKWEGKEDFSESLLLAFKGDTDRIKKFMEKVKTLPIELLDTHILYGCGRDRRREHLVRISGDPDFFMGADPNSVACVVADACFPQKEEAFRPEPEEEPVSLVEGFRNAGFVVK
ncbi:MAG: hypothetical protein WA091_02745 [Minisyncoccales bacterium]